MRGLWCVDTCIGANFDSQMCENPVSFHFIKVADNRRRKCVCPWLETVHQCQLPKFTISQLENGPSVKTYDLNLHIILNCCFVFFFHLELFLTKVRFGDRISLFRLYSYTIRSGSISGSYSYHVINPLG